MPLQHVKTALRDFMEKSVMIWPLVTLRKIQSSQSFNKQSRLRVNHSLSCELKAKKSEKNASHALRDTLLGHWQNYVLIVFGAYSYVIGVVTQYYRNQNYYGPYRNQHPGCTSREFCAICSKKSTQKNAIAGRTYCKADWFLSRPRHWKSAKSTQYRNKRVSYRFTKLTKEVIAQTPRIYSLRKKKKNEKETTLRDCAK